MTHPAAKFALVKNPSWIASVRLALKIAVLWAPTRLLAALRTPLLTLFSAAALLLLGITTFVLETMLVLLAGLLGWVTEADASYRRG